MIRRYSTNKEYRPFDLVEELAPRGLFSGAGRRATAAMILEVPLEDFIESIHSRNGFCRTLMGGESARAFDDEVHALLRPTTAASGLVRITHGATLIWGTPLAGS